MKRGKIIVIEGTDGSGKQTQSELLFKYYKKIGKKVRMFSFPVYDSPTGKIVGGSYLGKPEICDSFFPETAPKVDPIVSSLYFAADRRYNFLKKIESEIYKNDIIILDRYTTSNMGHQASKGKNKEQVDYILNFIEKLEFDLCELPRPDTVFFLYMPFEASFDLRKGRMYGDGNENSPSHLKRAEKNYIYIASKYNWTKINCIKTKKYKSINDIKSVDEIHNEIVSLMDDKINESEKMTRF